MPRLRTRLCPVLACDLGPQLLCKLDVILMFHVKKCLGEGKPLAPRTRGAPWETGAGQSGKSRDLDVVLSPGLKLPITEAELGVLTLKLIQLGLLI